MALACRNPRCDRFQAAHSVASRTLTATMREPRGMFASGSSLPSPFHCSVRIRPVQSLDRERGEESLEIPGRPVDTSQPAHGLRPAPGHGPCVRCRARGDQVLQQGVRNEFARTGAFRGCPKAAAVSNNDGEPRSTEDPWSDHLAQRPTSGKCGRLGVIQRRFRHLGPPTEIPAPRPGAATDGSGVVNAPQASQS